MQLKFFFHTLQCSKCNASPGGRKLNRAHLFDVFMASDRGNALIMGHLRKWLDVHTHSRTQQTGQTCDLSFFILLKCVTTKQESIFCVDLCLTGQKFCLRAIWEDTTCQPVVYYKVSIISFSLTLQCKLPLSLGRGCQWLHVGCFFLLKANIT